MTQSTRESIEFDEAVEQTEGTKRILLLGDGFRVATLKSLSNHIPDPSMASESRRRLIDSLAETIKKINHESLDDQPIEIAVYTLQDQLSKFKGELLDMIGEYEAYSQGVNYDKCIDFLSHFISISRPKRGQIYYLNYDLLLYRVLEHDLPPKGPKLNSDDGFGHPKGSLNYSIWKNKRRQNIFYPHGSLRLFRSPEWALIKLEPSNSTPVASLIRQIRQNMSEGKMPLVVMEGNAEDKRERIMANPYLKYGFSNFRGAVKDSKTSLFIFGCSLSEVDKHIQDAILGGNCNVFCSTYGTPPKGKTGILCTHCNKDEDYPAMMSDSRLLRQGEPVFFCAESAKIWG